MIRMGLSKEKVKLAKDAILARQQYPSVDAVRIELGNTGSKSTIHKYLKELENEYQNEQGVAPSLSETLQNFVAQLAKQLHLEADQRIDIIKSEYAEKEKNLQQQIAVLTSQEEALQNQLSIQQKHQKTLQDNLENLKNNLQDEQVLRHRTQQQAEGLQQQLQQSEQHHQDLLEKFNHAQHSLEHYRESVKEQRQQDLRRHDTAIQALQHEIKQLQQTIIVDQRENLELKQQNIQLNTQLEHNILAIQKFELHITQLNQQAEQQHNRSSNQEKLIQEYQNSEIKLQTQYKDLLAKNDEINQEKQMFIAENEQLNQYVMNINTELKVQQKLYNELLKCIAIQQPNKQ